MDPATLRDPLIPNRAEGPAGLLVIVAVVGFTPVAMTLAKGGNRVVALAVLVACLVVVLSLLKFHRQRRRARCVAFARELEDLCYWWCEATSMSKLRYHSTCSHSVVTYGEFVFHPPGMVAMATLKLVYCTGISSYSIWPKHWIEMSAFVGMDVPEFRVIARQQVWCRPLTIDSIKASWRGHPAVLGRPELGAVRALRTELDERELEGRLTPQFIDRLWEGPRFESIGVVDGWLCVSRPSREDVEEVWELTERLAILRQSLVGTALPEEQADDWDDSYTA